MIWTQREEAREDKDLVSKTLNPGRDLTEEESNTIIIILVNRHVLRRRTRTGKLVVNFEKTTVLVFVSK